MPSKISGQRIGRSFLSPTGADNEVSQELDFQLGGNEGIEITSVLGYGSFHDDTPAASDTVPSSSVASQTLHLETGATEDLAEVAGEDAFDLDSEIIYAMFWSLYFQVPATAGGGGGGVTVTPSGLYVPPEPILSARNITHKATTITADTDLEAGLLISYHFVRFSNAELGVLLARR